LTPQAAVVELSLCGGMEWKLLYQWIYIMINNIVLITTLS